MVKEKILLASASPRRREILETAGIPFEVVPSCGEEICPAGLSVEEVVLAPLDVPESLNYSLFLGDLSTDENMDVNQKVAQIYGKKSVRVQSPE